MAGRGLVHGLVTMLTTRGLGMVITLVQLKLSVGYLGPHDYGLLTTALLLVGTFEAFTELGVGSIVVRRVAGGADFTRTVGLAQGIALVVMLPLTLVAIGTAFILYDDPQVLMGCAIIGVGLLATTWAVTWNAVAQVTDNFVGISRGDVLGRLCSLGIVIAAVTSDHGLVVFFVAQLTAPVVRALICQLWGRRQGRFRPIFDRSAMWRLFVEALPLTYLTIIGGIYFQLDGLILSKLATPVDVGAYNLAYRTVVNVNVIANAVTAVLMSRFSRAAASSRADYRAVLRMAMRPMVALTVPIATLLHPFSADIIRLIGSEEFVPLSTKPLDLLWISVAIGMMSMVISSALIAGHWQRFLTLLNTINLVINLVLNLILVPRFGATGAAVALIVTEACGFIACLVMLTHRLSGFIPWKDMGLIAVSAAIALGVEYVTQPVYWIARGLIVAAVYFGCVYLFRVVTPARLRELSDAA